MFIDITHIMIICIVYRLLAYIFLLQNIINRQLLKNNNNIKKVILIKYIMLNVFQIILKGE